MTPEEKYEKDFWYVLQNIKSKPLYHTEKDGSFIYRVYFPVLYTGQPNPRANPVGENNPSALEELAIIQKLADFKAIKVIEFHIEASMHNGTNHKELKLKILETQFNKIYKKYEKLNKKEKDGYDRKQFEIKVKDREIWVNNYLLSKPHGVGTPHDFFEYIQSRPNIEIKRGNLPSDSQDESLRAGVGTNSFINILGKLGFKGEILIAFFSKRSKDMIIYKGDKITQKDLEKSGIDINQFLRELKIADLKNNPNSPV